MEDDLLLEDDVATPQAPPADPWLILVVDDDPGVHEVTQLILGGFTFDGRGVSLLHAYSAAEGAEVLMSCPDIAVVLLDVVMETDLAGLQLAADIREKLKNHRVRIVLRTGQPASMSEMDVLRRYDVNDFRIKTDLTMQKLQATCLLALRGYRDIITNY